MAIVTPVIHPIPKSLLLSNSTHNNSLLTPNDPHLLLTNISFITSKKRTKFFNATPKTSTTSYDHNNSLPEPELCMGSDVLVEALEREGVTHLFAYPGGATVDIHHALLRRHQKIRTILPRQEQGGIFAAQGYASACGKPGVCMASSGPGSTNLVPGIADAYPNSVPIVAITGQVARKSIGTDAFQEVPMTNITISITKHNYIVVDLKDIPRVVKEAFFIAQTGRPGPVLIDIAQDLQYEMFVPNWNDPIRLTGYISRFPKQPDLETLEMIVEMISKANKPVLYVGHGCDNVSKDLEKFVELTGIPFTSSMMGLGTFTCDDNELLGMHDRTMHANYDVNHLDLLLAFGMRLDDLVTSEAFASQARIVHIDIYPSELDTIKQSHIISLHWDIKVALHAINNILAQKQVKIKDRFTKWRNELKEQNLKYPFKCNKSDDYGIIECQYVIQQVDELTKGNAIITTRGGQYQMLAAQVCNSKSSSKWISGTMGCGLPAAIGAATGRPGSLVIDVEEEDSFLMNVQELATIVAENIRVKVIVLSSRQYQEDTSYEANKLYPDIVTFAKGCDIPGERVSNRSELKNALQRMVETPGPYLLDVVVPHTNRPEQ